jgi:23S rRNA (guanosine2251-2'-O)-methyltransferase
MSRDQDNAVDVVYGKRAVLEALQFPNSVQRVYFAKDTKASGTDDAVTLARAARIPFDFVPQAKLNEIAGVRDHQGIAAKVSPIAFTPLEQCLKACSPNAVLVALDHVQHPKNLGMIVRTAAAVGASGVLLPSRGGALPGADAVRASAGTMYRVPMVQCSNLAQALRKAKDRGFWIYGLAGEGDASIFETDFPDRVVLVIGNETDGLRPVTRKTCDALVRIPLAEGVESLNASIAAGIALYQAHRPG